MSATSQAISRVIQPRLSLSEAHALLVNEPRHVRAAQLLLLWMVERSIAVQKKRRIVNWYHEESHVPLPQQL